MKAFFLDRRISNFPAEIEPKTAPKRTKADKRDLNKV